MVFSLFLMFFMYTVGIGSAKAFRLHYIAGWAIAAGVSFLIFFVVKKQSVRTVCLALSFLFIGVVRFSSVNIRADDDIYYQYRFHPKAVVELEGVIVSDVEKHTNARIAKSSFVLDVIKVKTTEKFYFGSGKVLVNSFRNDDLRYGDMVRIQGRWHKPYNFSKAKSFSYRDYLRNQGIDLILSVKRSAPLIVLGRNYGNFVIRYSLQARSVGKDLFARHLSKNEAGLMQAIVLGDRSNIPSSIRDFFVHTGTVHVLAISGFNVGIVAGLMILLLKIVPISRRMQLVVTVILLIWHAFLTGGSPSVVRATIMAVVFLMGFILEKEPDILNSLIISAFLILTFSPNTLFDVGFQLSFVCVLAIILLYPLVQKIIPLLNYQGGRRWVKFLLESLGVSLAVWIGVEGLIIYYFKIITPITVFANLIVVPLVSLINVLGIGYLLVFGIGSVFGLAFAACIKLNLSALLIIIYWLEKIPFSYFYFSDVNNWYITIYYVSLGLFFLVVKFWRMRLTHHSLNIPFLN